LPVRAPIASPGQALRRQLVSFAAVGVVGTLVHYSVLILLVERFGVNPVAATFTGFCVAAPVNYILNRAYTFNTCLGFGIGLLRNYIILAGGLCINVGTVALLVHFRLEYLIAQAIATILASIWNYIGSKFVVFI